MNNEAPKLSEETEALRTRLQDRVNEVSEVYAQSTYNLFRQALKLEQYPSNYSELAFTQQRDFWQLVKNQLPEQYIEVPSEVATTVIKGSEIIRNEQPEGRVYLASISKTAIASLFEELTQEQGIETIQTDAGSLIADLISRSQGEVLLKEPGMKKVLSDIFSAVLGTELPEDQGRLSRQLDILMMNYYDPKSRSFNEPLKSKLESYEIPVDTILMLALRYSANTPVDICRNYLIQRLGSYEAYAENLEAKATGYSPTKSTQLANHWIQTDANIGYLSEFLKLQHQLAQKSDTKKVQEYLSNNEVFPEPFFDFSASETGKRLRAQGYTIIEKTGYYDGVRWVEELAMRGLPAHMPFLSCVTVLDKEGKIVGSFSHYRALGIVLPEGKEYDDDNDSANGEKFVLVYPSYDDPKFKRYMQNIYEKYCLKFRQELEDIWNTNFELK